MQRRVVGDSHHNEGELVNRLLEERRISVRAAEVEARANSAHFSLSTHEKRANTRRPSKMNNAPLLIRLVRHPYRLRRAYFSRLESGLVRSSSHSRENFGVREVLDSRISFEAGSPVGGRVRAESPARISSDEWLQQEASRG